MSNLGDEYTPAESTVNRTFDRLTSKLRRIIMTSADEAANAVADQLGKAKSEIDGVISDLEGQSVKPETLERLQGLSQALDDVVPDAPAPEPTPEPAPTPEPSPGDVEPAPAPPTDEG